MPGPMPKDPAIRQRRNKSTSRAVLPAETRLRIRAPRLPKLPEGETWHPEAEHFWAAIWSSPMSAEFVRADEPALRRLVLMVNAFWNHPGLELAKEIRALEREFGLTPLSRRRLEWTIAQTEDAKDKREDSRVKRAERIVDVQVIDPRGVLE